MDDYDQAYDLYGRLLENVRGIAGNNHYNEINCLLRLAEIDHHRGDFDRSIQRLKALDSLEVDPVIASRTKKKRERARELLRVCQQKIAQAD